MADALIQQESFPDLVGWEDSVQKIASATAAVAALRNYRETQRAEIVSEKEKGEARERAAKIGAEIKARKVDLSKLDTDLGEIAKGLGTKEAGYAFQDWFYRLADFFEVENRKPYVSDGRQIDGSITVEGTTYLIELKFTGTQSDATDIDSLHKKVSGKADNTMGVMFSISGYSSVAIGEASGPKCLLLLYAATLHRRARHIWSRDTFRDWKHPKHSVTFFWFLFRSVPRSGAGQLLFLVSSCFPKPRLLAKFISFP